MTQFVNIAVALLAILGATINPAVSTFYPALHTIVPQNINVSDSVWTMEAGQSVKAVSAPIKKISPSLGVDLTALSALAIDSASGAILWSKNASEIRSIGSITKLMTALVLIEQKPDWNIVYTVEAADQRDGGKHRFLVGDQASLKDFLAAAIIASDNDSAMVLSRASGLSHEEFVAAMNIAAKKYGLSQTVFTDPTGLDAGNVSTAHDVIALAQKAFATEPINEFAVEKNKTILTLTNREVILESTNDLLKSFIKIKAAKTGFIEKAGYCIVAEVENDGRTIDIAILGSASNADRFQDLKMLAYWVGENYEWK